MVELLFVSFLSPFLVAGVSEDCIVDFFFCSVMILWAIWRKEDFHWGVSLEQFSLTPHSFGTGFDLIRTGHDANGVWATLEAGLMSVPSLAT